MTVYLQDPDVTLHHGDALTVLQTLPAESVHCCVTSPPFFGLRDYQTGTWQGGDPGCDHSARTSLSQTKRVDGGHPAGSQSALNGWRGGICGKCGAKRVDQQIGLEETPEQWVDSLVAVFREVRRVLRPEGVLFCEVGDSYNSPPSGRTRDDYTTTPLNPDAAVRKYQAGDGFRKAKALKRKDLIGAPWQLAFALRADGWYLRSDIIWARPNPMPESVTDRPTKSHSYIFLLAKQPRYFFDQEAVREPEGKHSRRKFDNNRVKEYAGGTSAHKQPYSTGATGYGVHEHGRNILSVWNIATQPYPEAHFATFPEELARRCILAGTSERGCCSECGAPWTQEVERHSPSGTVTDPTMPSGNQTYQSLHRYGREGVYSTAKPTGWHPSCDHTNIEPGSWPAVPCVVLDPFVGSGTVPYVARLHGRHSIGIDLNADYLELAAKRLAQQSLFAQPAEPPPRLEPHRGLTGGAYNPPGQTPHSNAR